MPFTLKGMTLSRDEGLGLAKAISEGDVARNPKNPYSEFQYNTPDGRPCSPQHPDAILNAIYMDVSRRDEGFMRDRKKPFRVRR